MSILWIVLIPFIAGILSWQTEYIAKWMPRWIAIISVLIILLISSVLWVNIQYPLQDIVVDGIPKWYVEICYSWIPRFGIDIHFALDGLSLLMLVLVGIIGLCSIICSWEDTKNNNQGLFYLNILWILGSSIGVFLSIDMFLFFFFWEMMLIPMYFLICLWGDNSYSIAIRIKTATKFFMYTQISSMFMLIVIISLSIMYYRVHGIWTFNYVNLLNISMPKIFEIFLMLSMFLAFAIKIPIVPLHGWLSDVHAHAPTSGAMDLSGILLKTGIYGILRFCIPLFPYASKQFALFAIYLGLINIFYGAWITFSQTDMKRFVAYANISHMGFVLLAIYSGNKLAYQGLIVHIISYAFSSAGIFIICGYFYKYIYTRNIQEISGLWSDLNCISISLLFFIISMMGFPGTGNFIGEVIILFGSFVVEPIITLIAVIGLIFSSRDTEKEEEK